MHDTVHDLPYNKMLGGFARGTMIETIISGVTLAALSGLTVLAYKHPTAFQTIVRLIWLPALSIMFTLLITDAIIARITSAMLLTIAQDVPHVELINQTYDLKSLSLFSTIALWSVGLSAALAAYFTFLWHLPKLIHKSAKDAA